MTVRIDVQEFPGQTTAGGIAGELGIAPDTLHPLLQGARARGFADAFEMLGQAVVLVSATGEALHLTSAAKRMMGAGLGIAEDHLVAATRAGNRRLGAILSEALGDIPGCGGEAEIADGLIVRAIGLGAGFGGPFQLLRAAVFIERTA
jgi:hypothetical protein